MRVLTTRAGRLLPATISVALIGAALGAAAPAGAATRPSTPSAKHVDASQHRPTGAVDDIGAAATGKGYVNLMLQLPGKPAATVFAESLRNHQSAASRMTATSSAVANAKSAQRSVIANAVKAAASAKVLFQVTKAYNGIAVRVKKTEARKLLSVAGISAVHAMTPKTLDNSTSDALIGAPATWESHGGLTGQGVTIGIIDTGLDYDHTDFGGGGVNLNNDHTVIGDDPYFPTSKVVGGIDLVGDDYQADPNSANYQPVPHPDPDPMDCNGHGSHVAGTAAGYGVNANGTTYRGAYNSSTNLDAMRIGPGVAPNAKLYSIRVFGCAGSTDVVVEAIDKAMDPNGDNDLSDHLDVINMSLGSNFGAGDDPDAVASNNAAAAGVQVVTSAGNSGDTTHIVGGPNVADWALSTASSVDSTDVVDGFEVTAPAGLAGIKPATFSVAWDWSKPAVTAGLYYPTSNPTGCTSGTFSAGDLSAMAGKVVILDWYASDVATSFACGSVNRTENAYNHGAAGAIVVDRTTTLSTSITGSTHIPAVFSNKDTGDALKTALSSGTVTVKLGGQYHNTGKIVYQPAVNTASDFTSRGPRRDGVLKPDIAAPGQGIFSVASGTGSEGENLSGTSMASPHMAGVMALLRQLHPTWNVEELKALAMNTADVDIWSNTAHSGVRSPARIGTGRVDVPAAAEGSVIAYDANRHGAVSLSYGSLQPVTATTVDRVLRIANKGTASSSLTASYEAVEDMPGVDVSFPNGAAVTVPAGQTRDLTVRLSLDPTAMQNTIDPSMSTTQVGLFRQALSEEQGHVVLKDGGTQVTRTALYAAVRPASAMKAASENLQFATATGTATLPLTGTAVDTGGSDPREMFSLASAYELQAISGHAAMPDGAQDGWDGADLKYVGVSVTHEGPDALALFALTTHGTRSMNDYNGAEFDIYIDADKDGTPDYVMYNTRLLNSNDPTDVFVSRLINLNTGSGVTEGYLNYFDAQLNTGMFDTSSLVMPLYLSDIGSTSFNYAVETFASNGLPVDEVDGLTWNSAAPGLDASDGSNPFWLDTPGASIPVAYNKAGFQANADKGLLVLHHLNSGGSQAEVVPAGVLTSVEVTPASPSIAKGTTQSFTAIAHFDNGATQDVTDLADWSASGSAASVSNSGADKGTATGWAVGSADITAAYSGQTGSATLSVTPAELTSIAVSAATGSMPKGTTQQLSATGTYTDGSHQDLTDMVAWSSVTPSTASVDSAGVMTALATGSATIRGTMSGKHGDATVTVTPAALTSITVAPLASSIAKGLTRQFTATGHYSDGTSSVLSGVTWSSTGSAATITSTGKATALAVGTATITAVKDGVSTSTTLTVTPAQLLSIAVTPATATVAHGGYKQYVATGTFTDGKRVITKSVVWKSSNTAVATIVTSGSWRGLAHAVKAGKVTISATIGAVVGKATLTVS